jgi:cytochrome c553
MLLALTALPLAAAAQSVDQRVQVCAVCHGANGIPQQKAYPVIWGQQLGYLYLQLRDFHSGARKSAIMSPIAATLTRDDMMTMAKYFSQKPWPDLQQPRARPAVAAQAQRASDSIGCTGCHQDGYVGAGTQPRLAGQNKDYLAKTMADFRNGNRSNNPGMSDLMKATPETDFAPLAEYLAGL